MRINFIIMLLIHGSSNTERANHVGSAGDVFTIDRKYNNLAVIGKGSYGVVCSATDTSRGDKVSVAIKKITPISKHYSDAKHVLREIRLMRHLGVHANIISLLDLHVRDESDELYIIMELLDSDLHKVYHGFRSNPERLVTTALAL